VGGNKTLITIDDRLPVSDSLTPVNARPSNQGAWWLVLLEKAFAKLNLNYANLDGGMSYEAMRALTGQPVVHYITSTQTEPEIWQTISLTKGQHFVMTASCLKDQSGLLGGHAYTLLDVIELKGQDG